MDQSISKDYFISKFEIPNKPVIISNLTDQWISNWTFDKLLNEFGDHEFKVGMDDDGNRVTLPFRIFYKYL